MSGFCFGFSRFCISAWTGAASLFVVATLREVQATELDSTTKAILATLRFPAYYLFAFALVTPALLCGLIAWLPREAVDSSSTGAETRQRPRRHRVMTPYLALIIVSFGLLVADYLAVYPALSDMTRQLDHARPASFQSYHRASMWINTAFLLTSLLASLMAAFLPQPTKARQVGQAPADANRADVSDH